MDDDADLAKARRDIEATAKIALRQILAVVIGSCLVIAAVMMVFSFVLDR